MLRVGSPRDTLPRLATEARMYRFAVLCLSLAACQGGDKDNNTNDDSSADDSATIPWECVLEKDAVDPEFAQQIGCQSDFDLLAADPFDASIPGAHSAKTVVDRLDDNAL